jgi:hypothetical protein
MQNLTPTAKRQKAIRDKRAAMTADRRKKKAENQRKRRKAKKEGRKKLASKVKGIFTGKRKRQQDYENLLDQE